EVERERVAEVQPDAVAEPEMRLQRAIDLDRMDEGHAVGQVAREDAQARPHLEHHVGRREPREPPDHVQKVVVDEEVLPQALLRPDAIHGSAKTAVALASISAASSSTSSPRAAASAATVWTTCAGPFGR